VAARFGGASTVTGERILLDGKPLLDRRRAAADVPLFQKADVFLPIGPFIAAQPPDRGWHPGMLPIARLKDGVSIEQASTESRHRGAPREGVSRDQHQGDDVGDRAQDVLVQGVRTRAARAARRVAACC
jgi:hypothetical protein